MKEEEEGKEMGGKEGKEEGEGREGRGEGREGRGGKGRGRGKRCPAMMVCGGTFKRVKRRDKRREEMG